MKECLFCNTDINHTYNKKFCNSSCAASYNNKIKPKRIKLSKKFKCLNCYNEFERRPSVIKKGYIKFCCINCVHDYRQKLAEEKFNEGKITDGASIRRLMLRRYGNICSVCKLNDWFGRPMPVWVDHIDGCAANNHPTNLRLICPNCDTFNETFGGRNKGKGRKTLGIKK